MGEYIEIVHLDRSDLGNYLLATPKLKEIAENILSLDREGKVNYKMFRLNQDPQIDKNCPIRVGGTLWEVCVDTRAKNLAGMGYKNVKKDKSISFSDEDY